ncbi:MAG: S-layer homology domain-containing protein, partial [Candidatus Margulisiibacteriota bacterium]
NTTHLGLEFRPAPVLAIRLGSDNSNLAMGLGYEYAGFTFDYAYRILPESGNTVSQAFSVGYVGGWVEEKKTREPALSEYKLAAERKPLEIPVFTDVPSGYYAKEAIDKMAALDIMSGLADGSFQPEQEITRAQLALVLVRSLGKKTSKVTQRIFKDIPEDFWASSYVKSAVELGLIEGYPDGTFRPNWPMTRAEVVAVLARFDHFPEITVTKPPYDDVPIDYWAAGMITEAKKRGILSYIVGDQFLPKEKVTRGELAQMLYHTDYFKNKVNGAFGQKAK